MSRDKGLKMEEEDIIFEEMPSKKEQGWNMKWEFPHTPGQKTTSRPSYIAGRYSSLYAELKQKCNPENFMSDYNCRKLEVAHDIFVSLDEHQSDLTVLKSFRRRAMTELGVKFATEKLFHELKEVLNPVKYSGNKDLFSHANRLYDQVLAHADDVEALEGIKEEALADEGLAKRFAESVDEERKEDSMDSVVVHAVFVLIILIVVLASIIKCSQNNY